MGEETGEPPDVGGEPDAASVRIEADRETPAAPPKLHMTGRGLSPAEYRAQHGGHPHQADFSRDGDGDGHGDDGDGRTADGNEAGRPDRP